MYIVETETMPDPHNVSVSLRTTLVYLYLAEVIEVEEGGGEGGENVGRRHQQEAAIDGCNV